MSLATGFALGRVSAAYDRSLAEATRAHAGIQGDRALIAEIQRLRAELAAANDTNKQNYDSAISWRNYAAQLEERIEALLARAG